MIVSPRRVLLAGVILMVVSLLFGGTAAWFVFGLGAGFVIVAAVAILAAAAGRRAD